MTWRMEPMRGIIPSGYTATEVLVGRTMASSSPDADRLRNRPRTLSHRVPLLWDRLPLHIAHESGV